MSGSLANRLAVEARAELAAEMLDLLDDGGLCAFWACEGPDPEPEDMVTCCVCRAVHELRKVKALAGVVEGGEQQ